MVKLVDKLFDICMTTTREDDINASIAVIDAILALNIMPDLKLRGCVELLAYVYYIIERFRKPVWHILSELCKSLDGPLVIGILFDLLSNHPPGSSNNRDTRGALAVARKLQSESGADKGYPPIPYPLLAEKLFAVAKKASSAKTLLTILQFTNALFDEGQGNIHRLLRNEDWSMILDAALECSKSYSAETLHVISKEESSQGPFVLELMSLITKLKHVKGQSLGDDYVSRQTIVKSLAEFQQLYPDLA